MPILNLLGYILSALPTAETLIGLAITGSLLVLLADWRLSVIALFVQYLLVTVLLSTQVRLEIALVRLVSGLMASAILYVTARRQNHLARRLRRLRGTQPAFLIGWPFRAVALVLVGATVISLSNEVSFLNVPALFWLLSLWLMGSGLLTMMLSSEVIKLGTGLLTFSAGFAALYIMIDPGLPVYGLLNAADLLIALAIAHLAGVPQTESRRGRRGES